MTDEAQIHEIDPRDEVYMEFQELLVKHVNTGRLGEHSYVSDDDALRQAFGALTVATAFAGPVGSRSSDINVPDIKSGGCLYQTDIDYLNDVLTRLNKANRYDSVYDTQEDRDRVAVMRMIGIFSDCFRYSDGIRGCVQFLLWHGDKVQSLIDAVSPKSPIDSRLIEMALFSCVVDKQIARQSEIMNDRIRKHTFGPRSPRESIHPRIPSRKLLSAQEHVIELANRFIEQSY